MACRERTAEETREVAMILVAVVVVIVGFLALVYWLDKRDVPSP
jgi:hypothetical protein